MLGADDEVEDAQDPQEHAGHRRADDTGDRVQLGGLHAADGGPIALVRLARKRANPESETAGLEAFMSSLFAVSR